MNRESTFKGVWVLIVCWLCVLVAMPRGPLPGLVARALGVDPSEHSPVGHLREFVANGACAMGALLVVCIFAATVWKRYARWTSSGVIMAWFILTPQIIFAAEILWRCLNLTEPTQAGAALADDKLLPAAVWAGGYSAIAIWVVLRCAQWFKSRHRAAGDRVQVGSDQ
jgi:hypothetical protein